MGHINACMHVHMLIRGAMNETHNTQHAVQHTCACDGMSRPRHHYGRTYHLGPVGRQGHPLLPSVDHGLHDEGGQFLEILLLHQRQAGGSGLGVDDAQRPELVPLGTDEGGTGVEADVGRAGDEAVVAEARILQGVGDDEEVLGGLDGVGAEGHLAGGFADVAQAAVGQEPLPPNVDERYEDDGHVEEALGQARQALERWFAVGIEDEVGLEDHEPVGLVGHRLPEAGFHEHVLGDPIGLLGVREIFSVAAVRTRVVVVGRGVGKLGIVQRAGVGAALRGPHGQLAEGGADRLAILKVVDRPGPFRWRWGGGAGACF